MHLKLHLWASVAITLLAVAQCDPEVTGCDVNNCLNGATCKPLTNGDVCICARGYWGKHCDRKKDRRWDVTYVIGHSANQKLAEWQKIKDFVDHIISNVPNGQSASQFALVTYMPESRIVWKLNDHNVTALKQAISQLQDTNGPSDLASALALICTEVFTQAGGDRHDVRNAVVILIDGVSSIVRPNVVQEAEACNLAGNEIYVIAIGKRALVNMNHLLDIAMDERRIIKVDSFDELQSLADYFVYEMNNYENPA